MSSATNKRLRLTGPGDSGHPAELFAPESMFFHLIPQPAVPELDDEDPAINPQSPEVERCPQVAEPGTTPPPATPYSRAIARVEGLTSHLTPAMRAGLTSLLSTLQTDLPPGDASHPLITRIASTVTSDDTLREMANTIDAGLLAFAARGGRLPPVPIPIPLASAPSPPPTTSVVDRPKSTSSSRSHRIHRDCAQRDKSTCILTGKRGAGIVAHLLPFSIRASKAVDFWAFLALFYGAAETAALKTVTLGSAHNMDVLANVAWMSDDAHRYFGLGQIALLPVLTATQLPYHPHLVAEVSISRHSTPCPALADRDD